MTSGCRDLRVEHLHAPLGVHTRVPRFSWIAGHDQIAYRIVVRAREAVVWDTGRVAASGGLLVEYAGTPLRSNVRYDWTVTSWSTEDGSATAASTFETALLDAADWRASWVVPAQEPTAIERWTLFDWIRGATTDGPPRDRLRPAQLLRQTIELPSGIARARLFATARGVYTAWINGERVGDEVLAPGFDSYIHRISAQVYDVTTHLEAGENVLALALADGWWAGRIGITGSSAQFGDTTSAIWQLHVEFDDGSERVFGSGDDVVSSPGGWVYADLFVGEHFDARRQPTGWRDRGFDEADWMPVAAAAADTPVVVPMRGEPVRRVAQLAAASVRPDGESTIVDFGQNVAGRVRLRLHDTVAGQTVTVRHTEILHPDGSWFENIAGMNKEQTDVYVCAGGALEEWEPEFTFHGFRFVRVEGAPIDTDDITAVVIASDLDYDGSFQTSDPRLNRLHDNVVWSQRANFLSIPTDCPQRERAGWTGDIQVFAPAATNNADVRAFLARWLDNLRADQLDSGAIPIYSPWSPFDADDKARSHGIGAINGAAGWGDAIVFVPWTLWERYGDRRALEENWDAMRRWVAYQETDAYALGDHFGDWLAPSTLEGKPRHEAIGVAPELTGPLIATMFRAQSLTIAARIAGIIGREAEASVLSARASVVREAFAAEHVDDDGDLPVRLQGVYVLALAFEMVPAGLRDRTAARLAELVRERGDRLDTGFLSVPYLLDVLWDSGHRDLARRVLWQSETPSWLYEVDHGATTIWESWDAVAPDGTPRTVSYNHYAFGCVDDWLYRRVAGLQPTAPGWRTATIEPDFEIGLEWARAHVGTPFGRLAVEWERAGDAASVTVTVPDGVEAILVAGGETTALPSGASTHAVSLSARPS